MTLDRRYSPDSSQYRLFGPRTVDFSLIGPELVDVTMFFDSDGNLTER